jgi:hypothetical protein
MNERMKELALLSNIEFTYDPTEIPPKAFAECWEDELEKFAELIVREYTQQLIQHGAVSADGTIVKDIKKHFGVEE